MIESEDPLIGHLTTDAPNRSNPIFQAVSIEQVYEDRGACDELDRDALNSLSTRFASTRSTVHTCFFHRSYI